MFKKGTKEDKEKEAREKKEKKEREEKEKKEKKEREKDKKAKKPESGAVSNTEKGLLPRSPREKEALPSRDATASMTSLSPAPERSQSGKEDSTSSTSRLNLRAFGATSLESELKSSTTGKILKTLGSEEYNEYKADAASLRTKIFRPEVYSSFCKIVTLARSLNVALPSPELCLLGKRGQGKFAFLESFLGHKLLCNENVISKRTVLFRTINDKNAVDPRIAIREEESSAVEDVTIQELSANLTKRDAVPSKEPIYVFYSSKYCLNMDFFVVPPYNNDERLDLVIQHGRSPQRTLLWFEEAQEWEKNAQDALNTVKQVDPRLQRTIFVYTNFRNLAYKFFSGFDANQFLSSPLTGKSECFFVTLNTSEKKKDLNVETELYDIYQQDQSLLDTLRYDSKFSHRIGPFNLKKYVHQLTWIKYKKVFPQLMEELRNRKVLHLQNVNKLQLKKQITKDKERLRETAAAYMSVFLGSIQALTNGTIEGDPIANGQTLLEEKNILEIGEWVDAHGDPISLDSTASTSGTAGIASANAVILAKIPYSNARVFGTQQFERLVFEFQTVSSRMVPSPVTTSEIAISYSPRMNILWAGIDIAGRKLKESFIPLIKYLHNRAFSIFARLLDIVNHNNFIKNHGCPKVVDTKPTPALPKSSTSKDFSVSATVSAVSQAAQKGTSTPLNDQKLLLFSDYNERKSFQGYPFLSHKMVELYLDFLKANKKLSKARCYEEFYSTSTIYWELINFPTKTDYFTIAKENADSPEKAITTLTAQIFDDLKARVATNVIVNLYNHFLNPIKLGQWGEIVSVVSGWGDDYLEQLFEVEVSTKELEVEEQQEQSAVAELQEYEMALTQLAGDFAHLHR